VKRLIAPLLLAAIVGAALLVTAFGADGGATGNAETPGKAVPALSVARLDGGEEFALGGLASAQTPSMLWFWAPWCEVCNHQAPRSNDAPATRGASSR
jgi:uncharacterized RDD family membrane protein YckC